MYVFSQQRWIAESSLSAVCIFIVFYVPNLGADQPSSHCNAFRDVRMLSVGNKPSENDLGLQTHTYKSRGPLKNESSVQVFGIMVKKKKCPQSRFCEEASLIVCLF